MASILVGLFDMTPVMPLSVLSVVRLGAAPLHRRVRHAVWSGVFVAAVRVRVRASVLGVSLLLLYPWGPESSRA